MPPNENTTADQTSDLTAAADCSTPGFKGEIYEARKQAKQLRTKARIGLMKVARSRREVVADFTREHPDFRRGRFNGFKWNDATMCVDVWWDTGEGCYSVPFPQTLLWSDAPLLKLRGLTKEADRERRELQARREIEERDRLLEKYPVP